MPITPHDGFIHATHDRGPVKAGFYVIGSHPAWQQARYVKDREKYLWVRAGPPDERGNFIAFLEDGTPLGLANKADIELVPVFANWVRA